MKTELGKTGGGGADGTDQREQEDRIKRSWDVGSGTDESRAGPGLAHRHDMKREHQSNEGHPMGCPVGDASWVVQN